MSLSQSRLHHPQSLAEALKLMRDFDDARLLAGGTDILVEMKGGEARAKHLISLQRIDEMKGIEERNGEIRIGALSTPRMLASNALVIRHLPALADAAASMASNQIRSMATVGGNIVSAVPSADLPPSLIAAESKVTLICSEDVREISLLEFFTGPRMTVCRNEEILTEVRIPFPRKQTGLSYQKLMLREANALAVASVAARLTLKAGFIDDAALVLGAVAPIPFLATRASDFLKGQRPSEDAFGEAAGFAKTEAEPISDIRGSMWYRRELVAVLTRRSLRQALNRAEEDL